MADIAAEIRKDSSKRATKQLRQKLMVPAIIYGHDRDPLPVAVSEKELTAVVRAHGHSALCTLSILANGDEPTRQLAIYKELRINALTRRVEHVDFQAIRADEKVHIAVPVHTKGIAMGVDKHGAILILASNEVHIKCLPDKIPDFLEIDVSGLDMHQSLHLRDIKLPEGIELADDPSKIIASCAAAHLKLETTAPTAAVEGVEGAAAPAAGAAPAAAGTAAAAGKGATPAGKGAAAPAGKGAAAAPAGKAAAAPAATKGGDKKK